MRNSTQYLFSKKKKALALLIYLLETVNIGHEFFNLCFMQENYAVTTVGPPTRTTSINTK